MEREVNPDSQWSFSYLGGSSPNSHNSAKNLNTYTLNRVKTGQKVRLIGFQGKEGTNRLISMGLNPGVEVEVISSQPSGSVVVAVKDSRLGIGAEIAENILVKDVSRDDGIRTYLKEMSIGSVGRIVGYEQVMRGYKGKLLSMGLTPGTEFTVIRVAPLGDPIEISVRGFRLSLRKQEADALLVEEVG